MRFTLKKCFCVLLAVAMLLLPVLPTAAAAVQTEEAQAVAVPSETGDGVRTLLHTVWNRFVLLWQRLLALLGVGSQTVRARAGAAGFDLLPVPTSAVITEKTEDRADAALLSPSVPDYNEIFGLFGFHTGDGGLPVSIRLNPLFEEEQYRLSVKKSGVTVTASGRRGVFCAVATLRQLTRDGKVAAAEIADRPAVAYRGVIEGFYGQPWTHAFRLDLFSFMGKYKLNTYLYAPKDDVKHRAEWRELYTDDELARLRELTDCAARNNVRFVYALSPGLDIDLGDGYDREFRLLCRKCESLYELGVRDFAILLDDIPTLDAAGHAKLVNDFQKKFVKTHPGCADLIMITTEYSANMLTGYTDAIAKKLDRDIKVMWTGNGTLPDSITTRDLLKINLKLGRKVYIWWNYPVNDLMPGELFMGPCENLDKNLSRSISGFVSNPMNQGYASEIPLLTVADYLWNPAAYQPEESLRAALRLLAPDYTEALYALIDLTRDTVINGGQSTFALREEIDAYRNGAPGAAQALRAALEETKAKLETLSGSCEEQLLEEIRPWLEKALLTVDAAILLTDYELAESSDEKAERALSFAAACQKAAKHPKSVSPDALMKLLEEGRETVNAAVSESRSEMTVVKAFTDLPTYQDCRPGNAVDGDDGTFFWSSAAPWKNACFTVDLGRTADVTGVRLVMGSDGAREDYLHSGVIEYAEDGKEYVRLCDTRGRETVCGDGFRARFVRVRCTGEQVNWVLIQRFEVAFDNPLPEGVSFDGDGAARLSPLFDRDLFTVFSPAPAAVGGKTLTIAAAGLSKVELFLPETGGLRVFADAEDGGAAEVPLSRHTVIGTEGVAAIRVVFTEKQAAIAEIVTVS